MYKNEGNIFKNERLVKNYTDFNKQINGSFVLDVVQCQLKLSNLKNELYEYFG